MNPNNFKENLVNFSSCRIKSAEVLWINTKELSKIDALHFNEEEFLSKFSYAIPNNQFFEEIIFDYSDQISVSAERYGGTGVGVNGGGARCGNIGSFQIKGIGRNPLAGETDDHWHTYGGLNLIDAIYETINAAVFSKILPIGVAHIYGIIITGKKTAILPGLHDSPLDKRRGYGALLIREACLRPAHFFRTLNFRPEKNSARIFLGDVARVFNVNQALAARFSDSKEFIIQISKYLSNYANQFAFARAARISHGSISPSNMCLDGRWLDLTNATFLEGGKNTGGMVSFYMEPYAIKDILEEFIYTFSKYNDLKLNSEALLDYYFEQFQSYFISHISYVVGVSYAAIPDGVSNPNLAYISNVFSKVIMSAKEVSTDRPNEYKKNDPVICLLEALFISICNSDAALDFFNRSLGYAIDNHLSTIVAFTDLMNGIYENIHFTNISYQSFIKAASLIAIKRSLVSEYFYMGRLEGHIYKVVKDGNDTEFCTVIEESVGIANWAFNLHECLERPKENSQNNVENHIVIFKTDKVSVWFDPHAGSYFCNDLDRAKIFNFKTYSDTLHHFNAQEYCSVLSGYCFSKYLERLGLSMQFIDTNI